MDFGLSKEQLDISEAAASFAAGEFDDDLIEKYESEGQFPLEIWRKACELGFIGMHIPEEFGGQGLGLLESALVFEAFSREDSGIGLALALSDIGSEVILRYGTNEQKESLLPAICSGEKIPSLAYMENEGGGNLKSFATTAVAEGDGYIINGQKRFVFNVTLPGPMILLCRKENENGQGQNAGFILEKDSDDLNLSLAGERVGMKMVSIGSISFNNYRLPGKKLLGGHKGVMPDMKLSLQEMNVRAAAVSTGIAQAAFNMAISYARRREQFRTKIISFEAIKKRLTEIAVQIEISRLLTYKAAWELDKNKGMSKLPEMAKKVALETGILATKDGIHIFGGYGYMIDYQIERFYRDAAMVDIIGLTGYSNDNVLWDYITG
ncbi:MAG: acyl-CoA/acyl-ACP dehydrogenase [Deltaproteobacteria bacterium]|nr:acyl-CoA/acyl-ACP dehydrogenase [Deltaproteobacteria bacterium]